MRRWLPCVLLAGALCPAGARGQDRSVGDDLGDMGRDAWFILRAPARASGGDLQTTLLVAGGAGALLLLDEPIHDWLHTDPFVTRVLRPFRDDSPVSLTGRSYLFLLPLSVVFYGAGHAVDSGDLRDAGLGCATTVTVTTLTRSAVANLIGRLRPRVHRGAFQVELLAFGEWDQRSFPGGHAANITSCTSFFNHRFDLGPLEPVLYGLALAVSTARIVDEAHWSSDTFVGMAHGFAVGKGVAGRFLRRNARREAERSLQPFLSIGWRITF